jgi:arabinogalactan endo-1,4-beta-galactosidase
VEQGGGVFYETNGVPMDCLQILKNHGCNIVRLRLYNDPGNPNFSPSNLLPPGIQSPTNILDLAARAKAKGLQIELTFYYSDGWDNVKPHDWANLSFPQLTNVVYNFTTNFMTLMKNQGTTPEYVSLGNEINGGILTPDGSSSNWPQLAQLLKMGYAGVKAVSPSTQVILHLNSNISSNTVAGFFNQAVSHGVNWDIIGCSYYPFWSGFTAEQARDLINSWYSNFNKPVLIMETGYNWSTNKCDGYPGQLSNNGPEPFPSTPLGQKEFMLNCFNAIKMVNQGHCIGDLYWDPIFICVPGEGWELGQPNVVDNTTLFDFTGHALPVLDAFYYNN